MRNLGLRLWSLRAQPQCNVSVIITRILESYMKSVLCFESEICSCRLSAPVVSVDLGARGSKEWCGPRVFMRQPDPTTGPEHLWTEAGIGCRREGTETGFVVQWCCVQQRSRGGRLYHDLARYSEFSRRCFAELEGSASVWASLSVPVHSGDLVLLHTVTNRRHGSGERPPDFL
jgi:hypothetical protein